MFHGRKLKHKTNKIHERALRVVYNDNQWIAFSQYTKKTLQKLAIEMFKVKIFILRRIIIILDINQEQNLRLIMLILKHMASNLYHTLEVKSGILYRKK